MGKKAVFITVRTSSTRLPNKALLEILGKPTIQYVIDRAKASAEKDIVVLCTTTNKADDVLEKIAGRNGILCFRGSENDKLERWKGAAKKFGVDFFVTADGDDLLCEPELMDLAFRQHSMTGADFIEGGEGIVCGSFTYGIKVSALEKVCGIKGTSDTEMMWTYFKDTGLFKTEKLECDKLFSRPEIRLTLDYEEDFMLFKEIFGHFDGKGFSLRDVIGYLDKNPGLVKINQFRLRDWADNQKKKTKLVLKKGA
ncbi:3-deoxy-manno-octulosonate cytidylyltransferase [uncultured archaeon]|nr:3-deoxy-manno-octulosonate cytidylyltransferase [uncultured archaeon]